MPKYAVYAKTWASQYVGEYEADTPEEAEDMAEGDVDFSLCHQCANVEISDLWELDVDLIPTQEDTP